MLHMKEKCEHNAYNKCLLPTATGQITIFFSIFGTGLCLSTSLAKPAVCMQWFSWNVVMACTMEINIQSCYNYMICIILRRAVSSKDCILYLFTIKIIEIISNDLLYQTTFHTILTYGSHFQGCCCRSRYLGRCCRLSRRSCRVCCCRWSVDPRPGTRLLFGRPSQRGNFASNRCNRDTSQCFKNLLILVSWGKERSAPLMRTNFSPLIEWTNYVSYLERHYLESEERTSEYLTRLEASIPGAFY